jgi:hypothetical protein
MSTARSPRYAASLLAAMALGACGGGDDESSGITVVDAESTVPTSSPVTSTAATIASTAVAPATTAPPVAPATTAPPAITVAPVTTGAPVTTAAPGAPTWQDPTGTFAIAFPTEPTVQDLQAPLPDGTSLPVTAYLAEVEGAAVIASCVVYPEGTTIDPTMVLDSARDGALSNVGAELVDSQPIELQGRPGVSYRGAIGEAGGVLARTFLDGLQLCQALVVGEPAIIDQVAPAFLDSFQFLQEAGA